MKINYDIIQSLTVEQIEEAYRYQRLKNATEDVKNHIEDMFNCEEITSTQVLLLNAHAEDIAALYLYKYSDCSLPENDVYHSLIEDYLSDAEYKNYLLISVFERDINTKRFYTYTEARKHMLEGLQHELDRSGENILLDEDADMDTDDYGIGAFDAWSNLEDNCDWKIIPLNE